ncbi:hypothetical protein DFH06DRAFT_1292911 [Mycena polygramma]|nr:hypothetical protein DFH06DRAFT_1292911 [Mycena polygramma]
MPQAEVPESLRKTGILPWHNSRDAEGLIAFFPRHPGSGGFFFINRAKNGIRTTQVQEGAIGRRRKQTWNQWEGGKIMLRKAAQNRIWSIPNRALLAKEQRTAGRIRPTPALRSPCPIARGHPEKKRLEPRVPQRCTLKSLRRLADESKGSQAAHGGRVVNKVRHCGTAMVEMGSEVRKADAGYNGEIAHGSASTSALTHGDTICVADPSPQRSGHGRVACSRYASTSPSIAHSSLPAPKTLPTFIVHLLAASLNPKSSLVRCPICPAPHPTFDSCSSTLHLHVDTEQGRKSCMRILLCGWTIRDRSVIIAVSKRRDRVRRTTRGRRATDSNHAYRGGWVSKSAYRAHGFGAAAGEVGTTKTAMVNAAWRRILLQSWRKERERVGGERGGGVDGIIRASHAALAPVSIVVLFSLTPPSPVSAPLHVLNPLRLPSALHAGGARTRTPRSTRVPGDPARAGTRRGGRRIEDVEGVYPSEHATSRQRYITILVTRIGQRTEMLVVRTGDKIGEGLQDGGQGRRRVRRNQRPDDLSWAKSAFPILLTLSPEFPSAHGRPTLTPHARACHSSGNFTLMTLCARYRGTGAIAAIQCAGIRDSPRLPPLGAGAMLTTRGGAWLARLQGYEAARAYADEFRTQSTAAGIQGGGGAPRPQVRHTIRSEARARRSRRSSTTGVTAVKEGGHAGIVMQQAIYERCYEKEISESREIARRKGGRRVTRERVGPKLETEAGDRSGVALSRETEGLQWPRDDEVPAFFCAASDWRMRTRTGGRQHYGNSRATLSQPEPRARELTPSENPLWPGPPASAIIRPLKSARYRQMLPAVARVCRQYVEDLIYKSIYTTKPTQSYISKVVPSFDFATLSDIAAVQSKSFPSRAQSPALFQGSEGRGLEAMGRYIRNIEKAREDGRKEGRRGDNALAVRRRHKIILRLRQHGERKKNRPTPSPHRGPKDIASPSSIATVPSHIAHMDLTKQGTDQVKKFTKKVPYLPQTVFGAAIGSRQGLETAGCSVGVLKTAEEMGEIHRTADLSLFRGESESRHGTTQR